MTPTTRRNKRRQPALMANAKASIAQLGPELARIREVRGMTGPQIEKMTDYAINRSAVSRLESGVRVDPHVSTLLVLAVAYDVDFLISRRGVIVARGTHLNEVPKEKP